MVCKSSVVFSWSHINYVFRYVGLEWKYHTFFTFLPIHSAAVDYFQSGCDALIQLMYRQSLKSLPSAVWWRTEPMGFNHRNVCDCSLWRFCVSANNWTLNEHQCVTSENHCSWIIWSPNTLWCILWRMQNQRVYPVYSSVGFLFNSTSTHSQLL